MAVRMDAPKMPQPFLPHQSSRGHRREPHTRMKEATTS